MKAEPSPRRPAGGIGWALALVAFAAIRERLAYADMPASP
jgi:Na+-transporting NADH:ubiquinone oxidoreductase subunit NqrE